MKLHHVLFIAACFVLPATDAWAQPKNSAGTPCISSGSERHVGKGSDGKKYDCMMDYCTTCGVTSGVIDCSTKVTEWSNATDCKPVAQIGANQSLINRNLFDESLNFDSGTPNHGDAGAGAATGGTKGTVDGGAGGTGGGTGGRGGVAGNFAGASMSSGGGATIL
jgi:hypothetical protein